MKNTMSSQDTTIKTKKSLLIISFIIVILCSCIFAGIGYHYLTYRNLLMRNAVVDSGEMSVRMLVNDLERDIISQEKKMIFDVVFHHADRFEIQSLDTIKSRYPIINTLFVYTPPVSGSNMESNNTKRGWLIKLLEEKNAGSPLDVLTLRHFTGYFNELPVQAGCILLPQRPSATSAQYLIFTLDLDYIRKELLPRNKRLLRRSLSEITVKEVLRTSVSDFDGKNIFVAEASFHDILPFWNITAKIDNLGMEKRSRMEFIVYSYVNSLVLLLIAISVYFIWRQIHQEQELSRVKSQMISQISHELKTPLALIRMYTETLMLGRVAGPEKTRDYYRIILSECDHLHLLINNTLDFSSIERGMKKYQFSQGNIVETVQNVISLYGYYLQQHGFAFSVSIDEKIPLIFFDKLAMKQIISNLLDNAMKFSPEEKTIHLKLVRKQDNLELEVTDNGIGIDVEALEMIFKPYRRLSNRFRGSGIGLSLVKHAVEAHRGSIYALSKEGLGSTFIVTIPLLEGDNVIQG